MFLHHGTGVPIKSRWFWGIDNLKYPNKGYYLLKFAGKELTIEPGYSGIKTFLMYLMKLSSPNTTTNFLVCGLNALVKMYLIYHILIYKTLNVELMITAKARYTRKKDFLKAGNMQDILLNTNAIPAIE